MTLEDRPHGECADGNAHGHELAVDPPVAPCRILLRQSQADGDGARRDRCHRLRAWKVHLATLAQEIGLDITVCHYPPGTSKWNKIEHRMFSFITMNWRGRPLTSLRTVIELISATTTKTGLAIQAADDPNWYPTGVKISDAKLAAVPLTPHEWHGDWNYTITAHSDVA